MRVSRLGFDRSLILQLFLPVDYHLIAGLHAALQDHTRAFGQVHVYGLHRDVILRALRVFRGRAFP